jgi:membrane-associated protein
MLLLVPLLAFLESCLFIGLFISGIFLLSTVSLIYAQGETGLVLLVGLSFAGALLGDHVGYVVGSVAGPVLLKNRWVRKQLIKRKQGYRKFRNMLTKSVPWAICLGRLYPPTRSISPVLAGASGIKLAHFFVYDLFACTVWAGGLTLLVFTANQIMPALNSIP